MNFASIGTPVALFEKALHRGRAMIRKNYDRTVRRMKQDPKAVVEQAMAKIQGEDQ